MSRSWKDRQKHGYNRPSFMDFKPSKDGHLCGHTGKRKYESHEQASEQGRSLRLPYFRVYRCGYCSGFHLTSKPPVSGIREL